MVLKNYAHRKNLVYSRDRVSAESGGQGETLLARL